jgi:hypothetical protein
MIENSSLAESLNVLVNILLVFVYRDVIVELDYEIVAEKIIF